MRPARAQPSLHHRARGRIRTCVSSLEGWRLGPLGHACVFISTWKLPPPRGPLSACSAVPSSGIEPAFPGLQPGAITRSATRAFVRPGWCPATGIVGYSIVRERSGTWASGESNPAHSVKSRVLRHQSFWPAQLLVAAGRIRTDSNRLKRPVPDQLGDDGIAVPADVRSPDEEPKQLLSSMFGLWKRKRPPRFPWAAFRRTIR